MFSEKERELYAACAEKARNDPFKSGSWVPSVPDVIRYTRPEFLPFFIWIIETTKGIKTIEQWESVAAVWNAVRILLSKEAGTQYQDMFHRPDRDIITVSFDTYDKILERCDEMENDERCGALPETGEIEALSRHEFWMHLPYLIWALETAPEPKRNEEKKANALINRIISEKVVFTD